MYRALYSENDQPKKWPIMANEKWPIMREGKVMYTLLCVLARALT